MHLMITSRTPTILIATLCMLAMGARQGQTQPNADLNMSCIDRFDLPTYPALVRLAGISGVFAVSVRLDAHSRVRSVSSELVEGKTNAKALLVPAIEHSVRTASFVPSCSDKTLVLVIRFAIDDRPRSDHPIPIVSFGYPNRFTISVPLAVMNVDGP
jgi:hypothetical protein